MKFPVIKLNLSSSSDNLADAYKTNKTDDAQVPKSPSRRVFIPEEVTGYGLDENGIFDFKVGE